VRRLTKNGGEKDKRGKGQKNGAPQRNPYKNGDSAATVGSEKKLYCQREEEGVRGKVPEKWGKLGEAVYGGICTGSSCTFGKG